MNVGVWYIFYTQEFDSIQLHKKADRLGEKVMHVI